MAAEYCTRCGAQAMRDEEGGLAGWAATVAMDPDCDHEFATAREVVLYSAVQRHQVAQYLRALGVEWVVDESLPGDKAVFRFDATEVQWGDIQSWVKRVTG